jgi:hypothetical protein
LQKKKPQTKSQGKPSFSDFGDFIKEVPHSNKKGFWHDTCAVLILRRTSGHGLVPLAVLPVPLVM